MKAAIRVKRPNAIKKSAGQFNPGAKEHQAAAGATVAARRKSQKLLSAMTGKQKANDQP